MPVNISFESKSDRIKIPQNPIIIPIHWFFLKIEEKKKKPISKVQIGVEALMIEAMFDEIFVSLEGNERPRNDIVK